MNKMMVTIACLVVATAGCISAAPSGKSQIDFMDLFPTDNLPSDLYLVPLSPDGVTIILQENATIEDIPFVKHGTATYRSKAETTAQSADELTVDIQLDIIRFRNPSEASRFVKTTEKDSPNSKFDGYIPAGDIQVAEATVSFNTFDAGGNPSIYTEHAFRWTIREYAFSVVGINTKRDFTLVFVDHVIWKLREKLREENQ